MVTLLLLLAAVIEKERDLLDDPVFAVVSIRSELAGSDRVGRKTTGLLCGPAGAVTWQEASPDPFLAAQRVAQAFRSSGLKVAEPSEEMPDSIADKHLRIFGTIVAAKIDACVPQHGLARLAGGRRTLKATGSLTIRWRVFDSVKRAVVEEAILEDPLPSGDKPESLQAASMGAMVGSAKRLAPKLILLDQRQSAP